jgi:catechol 2,3-dioxygenase-like lactoylglutathione lyase family enzyme
MAGPLFGPIDQIGYVVDDLDAAVAARRSALGVGPWTVFRGTTLHGHYRGQAVTVTMDVALAYQAAVQIELIAVRGDQPSPYADAGGAKVGAHHVGWIVDDLDVAVAEAERRGLTTVFAAGNDAVRVAYLDHPAEPGVLYELIEGAGMRAMMDAGIAATVLGADRDAVVEIDMHAGGQG